MPLKSRILALDLFRGTAAFGIVIFHVIGPYYNQLRSLYFFVDFFFLLSGFVLARAVSIQTWGGVSQFITRRAKRIFPMSISALLVAESIRVAPLLFHRPGSRDDFSSYSQESLNFLIALLLLQVFSHSSQLLLFPLWSLSAEWITNISAALTCKILGKVQVNLFILVGFVMLSLGLFTEWADNSSGWMVGLGRCFLGFGAGQLIHRMNQNCVKESIFKIQPMLALTGVVSYYLLLNTFGTKALILAPLPFGYVLWVYGKSGRSLGAGRLDSLSRFSGRYSYGLYVWHIPALGICNIFLKATKIDFGQKVFLNVFELGVTLFLGILLSYLVLKYVEKAPFGSDGLNSSRQEIK